MAPSMHRNAAKRVAVVGAGTSGLAACKHLLARGFRPVVFEAGASVGGLWTRTLASTRLQSPHVAYRFSDFPWPEGVDWFPRHHQVVDYLAAYSRRFGVDECVRFRSRVVAAEHVGEDDDAGDAELWAGNGEAFGAGVWRLTVQHGDSDATQMYEFDFLILCIGRFSGVPNIPAFPPNRGPDAFRGRVLHSMDLSDMDDADAAALVKGKRVAVVGSGKSAYDIAAECAEANGVEHPCTTVCRSPQWIVHDTEVWGKVNLGYLFVNRFAELMVRKPEAGMVSSLLATLLAPLAWLISKVTEAYYKKAIPMRAYGMEPEYGFGGVHLRVQDRDAAGRAGVLRQDDTDDYQRVVVHADLVILSHRLQRRPEAQGHVRVAPLQGNCSRIVGHHRPSVQGVRAPRIPQMAVIGYSESLSNIYTSEMMAKWVARFLDGAFRLPSVRRMEQSVAEWGKYMKRSSGDRFRRSCLGAVNIWYNDQLCCDMGCDPRRKKGLVAEWFQPYGPADYAGIQ
ncbi:hypothetical protein QOZ80_6BG0481170 [Eleusine coracana subsp. coracana]|nr:hypothetical protein QOZ80_6BG0481170 [Eleusine coracana subsp. coracana]